MKLAVLGKGPSLKYYSNLPKVNRYIIVNNLFDSEYNYSIYIFYEFLSILFNMYIVYYIARFHNSIPLLLNHEITSV